METMRVLEINASFHSMVMGENIEESSYEIIKEFHNLPKQKNFSVEGSSRGTTPRNFKGMTDIGEVNFKESEEKTKEWALGIKKERIGHYKIWKTRVYELRFQYFWKAEEATSAREDGIPESLEYVISFEPKTLALKHFGFLQIKKVFSFGWFKVYRREIVPMFGTRTIFDGNLYSIEIEY